MISENLNFPLNITVDFLKAYAVALTMKTVSKEYFPHDAEVKSTFTASLRMALNRCDFLNWHNASSK